MDLKFAKIRELFLSALEHEGLEAQLLYAEEHCEETPELLTKLEEMLRAHHKSSGFLASKVEETFIRPLNEKSGDIIGPYKLLQQIGEGGMGVVYMAEQTEPVERRVALKIIKPGMDTQQVIARFEAERQALAMMDHPNIAKVLDAGTTETGRPYFVMELVKGMPVTQYCDEQHLTPKERLELFVPICQAVQHAHQKGIIHRDLKPSNILVAQYDNKPVPKVIDFGVVKAISQKLTEKTMFTQYGQIVGTIEYMSPEQARFNHLDVDTRSDIYSLGVLLYELLTGETPFDRKRLRSAAFDELLRIIREEEPPKPSTKLSSSELLADTAVNRKMEPKKLSLLVRGELDWVVMKALEKDRNRRYETANAFAADIQRFLSDEPVAACPPSAGYRFRKFAQRNRTALNMSAVGAVLILLAVGSIGWMVRDRGVREEQAARERADRQARLTSQVSSLLEEAGRFEQEQKWSEALVTVQSAHAIAADGEVEPGVQEEVMRQLRDLEFVARLEEVRLERAFSRAGDFDNLRGAVAYTQAFREFGIDLEQLSPDEAVTRLKAQTHVTLPLAEAIDDFAEVRSELSGSTDPAFLSLVSIARGLDQDATRDQLRDLWTQTESPEIKGELQALIDSLNVVNQSPTSLTLFGRALSRAGLRQESVSLLREAQSLHPDDFWINFDLAVRLHQSGDFEGAIRYYSVAIALRPTAGSPHNNLGVVFFSKKEYTEAEACFRRVIELDSTSSIAQYNLGKTLYSAERWAESVEAYQKAIELDPLNAGLHHLLALSQKELGRIDEAEELLTKSIEYYQRDVELAPRDSRIQYNLATAQFELKRFDEAVESLIRVIELDPANSTVTNMLAAWLTDTPELLSHNPARAVQLIGRAIELSPDNDTLWRTLGMAHYRAGNWSDAITALQKSSELTKGDTICSSLFLSAMALWRMGNKDEARRWYDLGVKYAEEHDKFSPKTLVYRVEAGELLQVEDVRFRAARGRMHLYYSRWEQAAADFDAAAEALSPDDPWFEHACLRLITGDADGYRRFCEWIAAQNGKTEDPFAAFVLARACAVGPDPPVPPEEIVRWGERAVGENANAPAWYLHALGLALYRAGRLDEAIERLNESQKTGWGGGLNLLVLAMAHHQNGQGSLAREYWEQALRDVPTPVSGTPVPLVSTDWAEWQVLRLEAEKMMGRN